MIRRLATLLVATAAGFLALYYPMGFLVKQPPIFVIGLAAFVCVVPGSIVLIVAWRLRDKPPEVKMIGALATIVFRMGTPIGAGFGLYYGVSEVKEHALPFIGWGIVFYLLTLFVETRLLYIDNSGQASQVTPD